jgi:hemoglobin
MSLGPRRAGAIAALLGASLAAGWTCSAAPEPPGLEDGAAPSAAPADSLYARMGGAPVVSAIVSETIDRVSADPRLNRSFEGSNLPRIKRLLAEKICELAGGGCRYTGDTIREVHAGHHISQREFYGMVAILRDSMRRHHVRLRERNELLALLAPMKRDVVNVPVPALRREP